MIVLLHISLQDETLIQTNTDRHYRPRINRIPPRFPSILHRRHFHPLPFPPPIPSRRIQSRMDIPSQSGRSLRPVRCHHPHMPIDKRDRRYDWAGSVWKDERWGHFGQCESGKGRQGGRVGGGFGERQRWVFRFSFFALGFSSCVSCSSSFADGLISVMRAALDVFENEPAVHPNLLTNPNVVRPSLSPLSSLFSPLLFFPLSPFFPIFSPRIQTLLTHPLPAFLPSDPISPRRPRSRLHRPILNRRSPRKHYPLPPNRYATHTH